MVRRTSSIRNILILVLSSTILALTDSARAESVVVVERADLAVNQPLTGTVMPGEKAVINAGYAGRVEALPVPPQSPFRKRSLLAIISGPDLAAIIDANATTPQQVIEERWQKVYKPRKVRAPFDGFLLETRAGIKEFVKADQPLFVVTPQLSFEAIVPLKATPGMTPGMPALLWRPANPELKIPGRLREVLPGTPTPEKATLRVEILPAEDIALPLPGTVLDGQVTVAEKKSVITVPAGAISRVEGRSFVSVEVEEGLSDGERTQIGGLQPGQAILTRP